MSQDGEEDTRDLLRGRVPREDRDHHYAPLSKGDAEPVILQKSTDIAALAACTALMEIVAKRGGTRYKPSQLAPIAERLFGALPDHLRPLIQDEVLRVALWLDQSHDAHGEEQDGWIDPAEAAKSVMDEADISNRLDVVRLAIDREMDLEFEYHDVEDDRWYRLRARPEEVDRSEDLWRLEVSLGKTSLQIPVARIRWLMPVERKDAQIAQSAPTAEVITFPFGGRREEE